jgi:hypothetical protein
MAQINSKGHIGAGEIVKKKSNTKYLLGDLIVALYEEAHKESLQSFEQKVVVYAALKHLLTQRIRGAKHSISLEA